MPVTTPPTITALPTPPDPNDRSTFNSRAYPWSVAQQTFATEVGAVATNVAANATDAAASATTASAASETAVAASNYKGPWSSLTGALAIPAGVSHDGAVWALVSSVADVTAHTPGVSAQWLRLTAEIAPPAAAPGLVLIATLTLTAAANADALTVFSSTYDDYLILIDGVKPSTSERLDLRFAVAGAVDSSAVYGVDSGIVDTNTAYPPTSASIACSSANVFQSGVGFSGSVFVQNVNSSSMKTAQIQGVNQSDTALYRTTCKRGLYASSSAISGIRFFWSSGGNFAATGTIRIYGYSKT